jgi:hypothetical protein
MNAAMRHFSTNGSIIHCGDRSVPYDTYTLRRTPLPEIGVSDIVQQEKD